MSLADIVTNVSEQNVAIRKALEVFAEHEWLRQSCADKGIQLPAPDHAQSMASIAAIIAAKYELTVQELRGPGRFKYAAHPRQEAMWTMRQVKLADGSHRFSTTQIGRYFNRDHSTVVHGCSAYAARAIAAQEAAA
jgi:chromosomal replication initiation ATPase DnaA